MSRLMMLAVMLVATLSVPALAAQQSSGSTQTRNWSAIDTNHDHYISPEEMQAYLEHVWAEHGKKQ